jgi:hypothetical protein
MTHTRRPVLITSRRLVPAGSEAIFAFLSNLENQLLLASDHLRPIRVAESAEGRPAHEVRLRGPFLVRRTVHLQIVARAQPSNLAGRAWAGRRTTARIRWKLTHLQAATGVELAVEIERMSLLDRMLLALGGRRRLELGLGEALRALAEIVRVAGAESPLDDALNCGVVLARHASARSVEHSRCAASAQRLTAKVQAVCSAAFGDVRRKFRADPVTKG